MACTSAACATSVRIDSALAPRGCSRALPSSAASGEPGLGTFRHKSSALFAPMPLVAPVMMATFPSHTPLSPLRHPQRRRTAAAPLLQPIPRALPQRHRTLPQVVRALTGVPGMASLNALGPGARPPVTLATLRPPVPAGGGRERHGPARPCVPAPCWPSTTPSSYTTAPPAARPRRSAEHAASGALDRHTRGAARPPLARLAGVDLTTSEGSEATTAFSLRSEIGTDMPRWPRVPHGWRWLGRCPHPQSAGGQGLARRVRPGAPRVPVALRLAARACAPRPECLGGRRAAEDRATRPPQGSHGHGAHTRASGLEPVATRQRVRPTGPRRLCSARPRTQGYDDGDAGRRRWGYLAAPRGAGIRPLCVLVLPSRLPGPAMPQVARAQGQVCAQAPHASQSHPSTGARQRRPPLPSRSSPSSRKV